ncbi:MAG: SDR family NAD(P)-dependent oxidoreductase [Chitinophagaceae bacterium]|nr:MAG: SDR family NAD(P)-dependent oxidoreductase [Chitinophagaceae bacterium]
MQRRHHKQRAEPASSCSQFINTINGFMYTLITGASEGLGKCIALECAARGMNLVLVALPGPELEHLSVFISKNFGVKILTIGQDLTEERSAEKIYSKVVDNGVEINMLINNAGIGNTRLFEDENKMIFERQIRINVLSTTALTHTFLPMLRKHNRAYILNVGSLACFFSIPRKQVYGGTKSFIYFFSRSLRSELKRHNIHVSVLCPGGINSNAKQTMFNKSGTWISSLSLMNPEEIAPIAIRGLYRNKAVIVPGRLNRLFLLLDRFTPGFVREAIINQQIGALG